MELNKKTMKKIILLIIIAILLNWGIHNIPILSKVVSDIISLISPLLIGLCFAFLINLILVPLEKAWQKIFSNKKRKQNRMLNAKRPVCLFISILIFLSLICAVFFVLIPQLEKIYISFTEQFPSYMSKLEVWWNDISITLEKHEIILPAFNLNQDAIINVVKGFFEENGSNVVNKTLNITKTVFDVFITVVLAFVFSIYLLAQKEQWKERAKRFLVAFLPENTVKKTMKFLSLSDSSFTNFVTGQVMDALVIGFLCFIGMLIFRFPNALPVSVIVCFTALIPIFGAWIGAIIGAILILFVDPFKALWFIIFLVILQQIEGNLIYPKIVGKSVGLPGLWVLVAVTVGGSAFGILGMLLAVPLCSVFYTLIQEQIERKSKQ